jgi:hypothetical protein
MANLGKSLHVQDSWLVLQNQGLSQIRKRADFYGADRRESSSASKGGWRDITAATTKTKMKVKTGDCSTKAKRPGCLSSN